MRLWKLFVRVMKLMGKRCPLYLTAIFFMSAGWSMFSVMSSLLIKNVVDAAQSGDVRKMGYVIVGNIVGGIVALLIYRVSAITYNVEAKRAYSTLSKTMFRHEIRLPYAYYEEHHSGEFMSKLSYDMEKTGAIYGSRLRRTVAPMINVCVFLVPMLVMNWQITLILVGVNLVMLLINALLIEPMKRTAKELSHINVKMTEKLSNLLQGMEQARMYAAGRETVDEFQKENTAYEKKSNRKILYTSCLESCSTGFELLCALAFLMVGIYFVQKGQATLGALAAIYTLYGRFSAQFLLLGRYLPELIGCLANAQNIFDFLEEEREPESWYEKSVRDGADKKERGETNRNYLELEKVSFSYRDDKPLLEGYDLEVKQNESVAITGPSGCGKTTISKLLLGLYPMEAGDIRIRGNSYRELTNEQLRRKIAYVPQEPYLFNESVRDNIRLGRPEATEEEIIEAAKLAHAHDFIEKLENGYDTVVGERGNRLSGGQKQRIAIARAILKEADLILLDEATSALDNESERLVNEAMKTLQNGRTLVMIAHRPSTIDLADTVVEM